MATIKIKFRDSSVAAKEGRLFYQVIHNRVVRMIRSTHKLHKNEWDAERSRTVTPDGTDAARRDYLLSVDKGIRYDTDRLKRIINRLDCTCEHYTVEMVVSAFGTATACNGFISFARNLTDELGRCGKERTAETYTCVINSFARFRRSRDITVDDVDIMLISRYETYLREEGLCPNTTSFYMRNLRAIYNRAVEKGVTAQRNPFRYVYTGIDKTVKRAVPMKTIRRIKELDLTQSPSFDFARDLFMFSFYTRGMSFVDMAYLKKSNLTNGILTYRRQKTGQQLFIKWEKPMQDIVDKYDTTGSPYLLPIIRDAEDDCKRQYRSAAHLVNNKLKTLGLQLGLTVPLTSYVARHAWASIAKSKNVSLSVISEAMGHESENTTRIYLASLDSAVIDRANNMIMNSL